MKPLRSMMTEILQHEDINFVLTNCLPRRAATRFVGWLSRIEHPLVRDISIGTWRLFSDLDLSEAREEKYRSLHDCFVRRLKDGARPIDEDPALLVSPCDAIVGASGQVADGMALQIKGSAYALRDLFSDDGQAGAYRNGSYVTLRLTSSMYHHFHAPHDCRVEQVTYIPGDAWNVNPPALRRVARLYCRNERALIRMRLAHTAHAVTLVPVAAILVAGIRLAFLGADFDIRHGGARTLSVDVPLHKGEEMGWFEHGSTIIVFAPAGFALHASVREGAMIRVGQPLMCLPDA
jgi:phosphatidylserine decarboxylase